jgi:hypothetical protein
LGHFAETPILLHAGDEAHMHSFRRQVNGKTDNGITSDY